MIDDVLKFIRKGPEIASQMDSLRFNNRSVARGANDATFQFPVLISNTIPIDMASTVTRTMEKTYVAFTRTWLSMNPTIDITMDRNILQYLKRFHQNVSIESVIENLMVDENKVSEYLEKAENNEYCLMTNADKSFGVLFNKADRATYAMLESHQDYIREFLSDYDLTNFPYIGTKQTYTESTIAKAAKFRDKIKTIKEGKPDAYSSNEEVKAFVDKNYDKLMEISKFIEVEPENLKKEEVRGTIAILLPFIVAFAAIPFGGTALLFGSEVIMIIASVIYSILYYFRANKDADTARDLRKIRDTLNRMDLKKLKESDRKKIQKLNDSITDAVDAYTVNARVTKESGEELDTYTEAPADDFAADVVRATIANREKEQLQNDQKFSVSKAREQKNPILLSDYDVKKANDTMPYALQVRLMAVNDKNEFVQFMDFILGVKAIMHPVSSDEIVENIQRALKNQNTFFRFLRWTSGEISLVKNLILNIDDIKDDVLNRENGKNPWFGKLKRLKDRKVSVQNFTSPYMLVPNSTLVISSYEAEYLKSHYGIDVTDRRMARSLVHTLFLMAFIIVDDANGVIDILYDGSHDFQTYSLETLEKEVSLNSNKLGREIGRMISH